MEKNGAMHNLTKLQALPLSLLFLPAAIVSLCLIGGMASEYDELLVDYLDKGDKSERAAACKIRQDAERLRSRSRRRGCSPASSMPDAKAWPKQPSPAGNPSPSPSSSCTTKLTHTAPA